LRSKALIALLLIVLLPVAALGWLGMRLLSSERQALEHRVQTLIDAQLVAIDDSLSAYFTARRTELLADMQQLASDTGALREYARQRHLVRQVFVMDAQGERLHPPRNAPLTEGEQRFLERSADIWRKRDILYQSGGPTAPVQPVATAANPEAQRNDGWYVWHWGTETDLIFWRRAADRLIGIELEPAKVKADLIGLLPATGSGEDRLGQARVRLIDDRGAVAYQWGEYQVTSGPGTEHKALALRPLSHPLGSWKLAYYAPAVAGNDAPRKLGLASALAALALGIGALAWYLHREHAREARLAAQRVNFVNQVSHELKTPLTNIRMYAELLAQQLDSVEEKPRRYLDIIVAESQRLSRLILNVLNFGRMQREPLRLHRQSGCVDDIAGAALEAFRPALESKGVAIHFTRGAPASVSVDRDALEQILNNLLSNVEKYAAAGARLDVDTSQDRERSVIRVRDYGLGIPKRERERIFEPFYRLSSKLSDGVTGTGIGLTIARELARLHGGDLLLLEREPGACFEVSLSTAGATR
jgi:signal transduction histidine kinase